MALHMHVPRLRCLACSDFPSRIKFPPDCLDETPSHSRCRFYPLCRYVSWRQHRPALILRPSVPLACSAVGGLSTEAACSVLGTLVWSAWTMHHALVAPCPLAHHAAAGPCAVPRGRPGAGLMVIVEWRHKLCQGRRCRPTPTPQLATVDGTTLLLLVHVSTLAATHCDCPK